MEGLIADLLAAHTGERHSIKRPMRLSGGATRETWAFVAINASTGQELSAVLQIASGEDALFGLSRRSEFRLLVRAQDLGIPVAQALWNGELQDGRHYLITAFLEGETLGNRVVRSPALAHARENLPDQIVTALSALHRITPVADDLGLPLPPDGSSPARTELQRYETVFRATALEPHPVLELAFRCLGANPPDCPDPTLVHGDFRVGNFLIGAEGLEAILDWELCHWGDPLEDLGWMLVRAWRFGSELEAGGICSRREFLERYRRASGRVADAEALAWWELFGNVRWAILTIKQAALHLTGIERSVELASLGRLTAETEWEILRLIDA